MRLPPSRAGFCVALFLLATGLGIGCRTETEKPAYEKAPVILISIDTLRADRLPAYGYQGVRTPALDRFRADAILFSRAYSHVPLTFPSHATMFTGLMPAENGVRDNVGYTLDGTKHKTIPLLLKEKGYATGAAVSSYVLRRETGMGALFDWYDDKTEGRRGAGMGELQRPGSQTVEVATRWIDSQAENPFFFFLHLYEPHAPYEPPEPHRSAYRDRPYDGEIATVDDVLNKFFEHLRATGVYDRATIIVVSDHGEGLNDHGEEEHGVFLYREAIHVPLMVKLPDKARAGSEVGDVVQLADLFPTITQLAGVDSPSPGNTRSLLDSGSSASKTERRVYSETFYPQIHLGWSPLRSLVTERHHYVEAPSPELYDLVSDPSERRNMLSENRRIYAELRKELQAVDPKFELPSSVSSEEAAKLAALGYLGSSAADSKGPRPDPKTRIAVVGNIRRGTALLAAGRADEAVPVLKSIVESDPEITDAWAQLGKAYEQLGRYQKALASYQEAIRRSPSAAPKFALAIASIYLYLNDMTKAESHAKAGRSADPQMADLVLGVVALERGDFADAEAKARSAMTARLYKDSAIVLLARSRVKQGRPDEAVRMLDELQADIAQRGAQLPPLMEFVRGDALMRLGRVEEAEAAFRREIELFPRDTEAYASLAAVYLSKGNGKVAEEIMAKMLLANPGPSSAALAAQLFRHFGDLRRAEAYRRRAELASGT